MYETLPAKEDNIIPELEPSTEPPPGGTMVISPVPLFVCILTTEPSTAPDSSPIVMS